MFCSRCVRWSGMAAALVLAGQAQAADPDSCREVRFSDVGWTDITATTAATSVVLEALGYEPETTILSVPVTYASLKNQDIDVFLGNWMPTMEGDIRPYLDDGSVESIGVNLEGAKSVRPPSATYFGTARVYFAPSRLTPIDSTEPSSK